MTSVQTSVGSLLLDMAEWDPGNEPRHHAKEHCSRIDVGKKQGGNSLFKLLDKQIFSLKNTKS